jgi:hypothetical protein
VLDGTGTTASRHGIVSSFTTNLTIDGIKILGTEYFADPGNPAGQGYGSGILLQGEISTIEIKNCAFSNTGDQGILIVPGTTNAHLTIDSNTFVNTARSLFLGVSDGTTFDDIQFSHNIYAGRGTNLSSTHGDGLMIGSACTAGNTCLTNLKIHHNKFYGDWTSAATALIFLNNGAGSGGAQYGGNHVQIYDNQLAIDSDGVISPGYIEIWSLWNDVKIYNNTFGGYYAGSHPVSSCIFIAHASTAIDVKNNIFSGCSSAGTTVSTSMDAPNQLTLDYNVYSTEVVRIINGWGASYPSNDCRTIANCQASPFLQEAHGLRGDPKFTARPDGTSGHGSWTLQPSSPAIDKGVNLSSLFTTDLLDVSRPQGAAWDIGAYESASAAPPAAPRGLRMR